MSDYNVTASNYGATFRANELARLERVKHAMYEAALLGAEVVAKKVPVDVGSLKTSIHAIETPDGAELLADAPHAAVVETGTRPHMPPLQPLIDWVRRHRGSFASIKAAGKL
jgi:hypothetical protein